LARVKCEKLMPFKYFTLLFHADLKVVTTNFKTFTNVDLKTARKYGYQSASI